MASDLSLSSSSITSPSFSSYLFQEENLKYEEEIARNPFYLKGWLKYLEFKKSTALSLSSNSTSLSSLSSTLSSTHLGVITSSVQERYFIYERALQLFPRSYKLWYGYLTLRRERLEYAPITDQRYQILRETFERALVHMDKMPVIW